jgi:hypothetical protein
VRRGRPSSGAIVAAAALVAVLAGTGPASASEYSESLARKIEREVVYVDPKARPRVSTREAGEIRLRILRKALGRIKIAVVPESRAAREGGTGPLANAINRDLPFRGALLVVAGGSAFAVTSYENSNAAVAAVQRAFGRHDGDRGRQLLAAVDELAEADPGPSADLRAPDSGARDAPDFGGGGGDDVFDDINDTVQITTLIIGAAVALPFVVIAIMIVLRVRRGRKEQEEDWEFAQQGLRNELIALGDDIRALDVDTSMPGVNALGLADYEAAIAQYDRANAALDRCDENPRLYVAEARAALKEGRRRMSDAKVRLGATPTP